MDIKFSKVPNRDIHLAFVGDSEVARIQLATKPGQEEGWRVRFEGGHTAKRRFSSATAARTYLEGYFDAAAVVATDAAAGGEQLRSLLGDLAPADTAAAAGQGNDNPQQLDPNQQQTEEQPQGGKVGRRRA